MDMFSQISCGGLNRETVSPQLIRSAGLEPQQLYAGVENIIAVAQKAKTAGKNGWITLPFCHTVEAKAMGADICPADDSAGPRPGAYTRASLEDFPETEIARAPDAARLLQACCSLSQAGESVVYQVSGAISILSCFLDLSMVFKTWRKSPEIVKDIWQKLRRMLLAYCREICKAGVSHIAFADPAGGPDILGPKYTKALTDQFTLPFLRELVADCCGKVTVSVCPLIAAALAQAGAISAAVGDEGVLACACIKSLSKQPEKNIVFV